MAALKRRRLQVLQHPEPQKSCSVSAAPIAIILPQVAPHSQSVCRCADGCAYFRKITTKKGGISRVCQFHGHKVASGDLACDFYPGQPWTYGGGDD